MSLLCLLATRSALRAGMADPASWLTATERARLEAFGTEARRDVFLAGRWLARQAVREWRGDDGAVELEVADSGACRVARPDGVFVSISHSGDQVACAVAAVPVGVDIERLGVRARDHLALARAVHGPAQREQLRQLPPQARERHFLQLWTLKEAWLKAREQGLDFALMRAMAFDESADGDGGDMAVTEDGATIVAIATCADLPAVITPLNAAQMQTAPEWRRYRSRC